VTEPRENVAGVETVLGIAVVMIGHLEELGKGVMRGEDLPQEIHLGIVVVLK
jgi:hypothetical protein